MSLNGDQFSQLITARMERLPMTSFVWRIGFLLGVAYIAEALDIGTTGVVLPPLKKIWHLAPGNIGTLAIASTVGIILGLIPAGYLADRYGRKTLLFWGVVEYSLFTMLGGLSPNFGFLIAVRFLAGIGMGSVFPLPYATLNEFVDRRHRAQVFGIVGSSLSIGYFTAPLLGYLVIPIFPVHIAWRIFFIFAGLPLIYALVVRKLLPESPRWLAAKGRMVEAEEAMLLMEREVQKRVQTALPEVKRVDTVIPKRQITRDGNPLEVWVPPYLRNTLVGSIGMTAALVMFYAITTYMPTILVKQGFSYAHSLAYTAIMSAAAIPGEWTNGWLSERLGRKLTFAVYIVPAAIGSLMFGLAHAFVSLIVYGCIMSFFGTGCFSGLKIFYSEQFPTSLRITGAATVETVGRFLGGVVAPFLAPIALVSIGLTNTFRITALIGVIGAMVVSIWGRETVGKSLEDINASLTAQKSTHAIDTFST